MCRFFRSLVCLLVAVLITVPGGTVRAETVVFAVGEWQPFISQWLPNFGPHSERIRKVYNRAGIDVAFEFMPWVRAYEEVKQGRYDASFSWYITEPRIDEVFFPENPTAVQHSIAVYLKSRFPNGLEVTSLEEILARNLEMVGIRGYWYDGDPAFNGVSMTLVNDHSLVWPFLDAGRADLVFDTPEVARNAIISRLGEEGLARYGSTGSIFKRPLYPIFSRRSPQGERLMRIWDEFAPQVWPEPFTAGRPGL